MQLLNEILVILAESECSTCELKDQCNKMKKEKGKTLCAYLFELDEKIFWENDK